MGIREFYTSNEDLLRIQRKVRHHGQTQRAFISTWPVIKRLSLFDEFCQHLADDLAATFLQSNNSNLTFTGCSPTVAAIFTGLKQSEKLSSIAFHYLGTHPFQPETERQVAVMAGSEVIVFADVVASGQLLYDTIQVLDQHGVKVAAAYAFVVLAYEASNRLIGQRSGRYEIQFRGRDIPVYHAVEVPMTFADENGADPIDVVDYDRSSVYFVERRINTDTVLASATQLSDIIQRRDGNADSELSTTDHVSTLVSLGLWASTRSIYTIAVDHTRLLGIFKDQLRNLITRLHREIAASPQNKEDATPVLITTPAKADRAFAAVCDDILSAIETKHRKGNVAIFAKSNDIDASYAYSLLDDDEKVRGRPAIVLIADVYEAEQVYSVGAFLAVYGCTAIYVVSMVNRLSPAAASFLARVLSLEANTGLEDSRPGSKEGRTFRFESLTRLRDFSSADLGRMAASARLKFETFEQNIDSPEFRALSRLEKNRFFPTEPKPENKGACPISAAWLAEALKVLDRTLSDGEASSLIGHLDSAKNSNELFWILYLVLANIDVLGNSRFRGELCHKVAKLLRKATASITTARPESARNLELERATFIAVGLVSHLISMPDVALTPSIQRGAGIREAATDLLMAFEKDGRGNTESGWQRISNQDWTMGIAFALFHLQRHGLLDNEALESFRDFLAQARDQAARALVSNDDLNVIPAPQDSDFEARQSIAYRVLSSVNCLRPLAESDSLSLINRIQLLRRELVWPRPSHTPLGMILENAPNSLATRHNAHAENGFWDFRSSLLAEGIFSTLADLLSACGRIANLRKYARGIPEFARPDLAGLNSLLGDANGSLGELSTRLEALVTQQKREGVSRTGAVVNIVEVSSAIRSVLWGDDEEGARSRALVELVRDFELSVVKLVREAIRRAHSKDSQKCLYWLDDQPLHSGEGSRRAEVKEIWLRTNFCHLMEEVHAIGPRELLILAIENVVSNFRHEPIDERRVDASINIENQEDTVVIRFANTSRTVVKQGSTSVFAFKSQLRSFGLNYDVVSEPDFGLNAEDAASGTAITVFKNETTIHLPRISGPRVKRHGH